MQAAVFHGKLDLRIEEVPEPEVLPGAVKLRNAYAGICGTDLHIYFSPEYTGIDFTTPNPTTGATLPQILGHEVSGAVVEVGEGVNDLAPGDRVAVFPIYGCGRCGACARGADNLCARSGFHGVTAPGGGMSTFSTVPAGHVHKLPDAVDLKVGALVEPTAVAWHAVRRSGARAGQTALVVGGGPIGICLWWALRAHGLSDVLVSEPNAERRSVLAGFGGRVADPRADDLAAAVHDLTSGDGVDVAFDAAGVGAALESAISCLTRGGRLVVVAMHEQPTALNPTQLVLRETEMVGSCVYLHQDFDEVIAAMRRNPFPTDRWVDVVNLSDVVTTMTELRQGRGMKKLVQLDGS
jgi:(R,R)-butanediol dehydrogenase/meso-butanediol dehydrogenase/diacetyl reductase